MKICKQCEAVNSDDARFCENCGCLLENGSSSNLEELNSQTQQTPEIASDKVRCPYCGEEILAVAKKCKHCGEWLETSPSRGNFTQGQGAQSPIVQGAYRFEYQESSAKNTEVEQPAEKEMGLLDAVKTCLVEKYATFKGRATRVEYWNFVLFLQFLSGLLLAVIAIGLSSMNDIDNSPLAMAGIVLAVVVCFGLLCPSLAAATRRLHDTGKSGWWIFMGLIPYLGPLVVFILTLIGSEKHDNKYGSFAEYNVRWKVRDWIVLFVGILVLIVGVAMYVSAINEMVYSTEYNLEDYSYNYESDSSEYVDDDSCEVDTSTYEYY